MGYNMMKYGNYMMEEWFRWFKIIVIPIIIIGIVVFIVYKLLNNKKL